MTVVEEYWQGVVQRLQAEVDVFSGLIKHYGEQGRENEAALTRLLTGLLPTRLGVGTGLVIDKHDSYSKQTDIILFDTSTEPTILAQTTQLLFPVESVHACIEVKTRLRQRDIDDFVQKKQALLTLKPSRKHPDNTEHPVFALFAYDSQLSPHAIVLAIRELDKADRPDLVCVVNLSLIGGRGPVVRLSPRARNDVFGVALLREDDKPRPPTDTTKTHELIGEQLFPIIAVGDKALIAQPARSLLIFSEALIRTLARQQAFPDPAMSYYLDDRARHLQAI